MDKKLRTKYLCAKIICAMLIIAIVAVYGQTLFFDFVHWDDGVYVAKNHFVAPGITTAGLKWAWTTGEASNWHPLTWLSHMLDCQLFGLSPSGHHLTNLLLHLANTLLLFGLLKTMTGSVGRSAVVAALFALHPLHVETIAWVSQRKSVLSTLFGLLAIYTYVRYTRRDRLRYYLWTIVLLAASLLAKPLWITLPLVLLLLDYWPLRRLQLQPDEVASPKSPSLGDLLIEKVPLLLMSLGSSVITVVVQKSGGAMEAASMVPLPLRLANALVSYVRYMGKMFWPVNLTSMYPHPDLLGGIPWAPWQIGGATLLLTAISALILASSGRRYLVVGWLWYVGTLIPMIGLIQVGRQAMADRYTYVPLIGLFVLIAWGVGNVLQMATGSPSLHRWAKLGAGLGIAGIVFACLVTTSAQALHWRSSLALFEQRFRVNLVQNPDSSGVRGDLGSILFQHWRNDIIHMEQNEQTVPNQPEHAYHAKLFESIQYLKQAAAGHPNETKLRYSLGCALKSAGRLEESSLELEEAVKLDPYWPAMTRLAWILATHPNPTVREPDRAVQIADRAARLTQYKNATVLDTLAAAYASADQYEQAVVTTHLAMKIVVAQLIRAREMGENFYADEVQRLNNDILKRLQAYKQNRAYHETVETVGLIRPMIPDPPRPVAG